VRAKELYVRAAHGLRGVLRPTGLLDRMAESRRPRVRHLRSLLAIYDASDLASLDLPWWTYDATREIDAFLRTRTAPRAFEFGSGASTLWLAARVDHVTSVEHDETFAIEVEALLGPTDNATLLVVPPSPSDDPATPSDREGHEHLDFTDYVRSIDTADGPFDLIVVDGRARLACLERARDHLAPGGRIVFDDIERERYRPALRTAGLQAQVLAGAKPSLPYRDATAIFAVADAGPSAPDDEPS
jgi:predicted O-methyltransferase YrrM